MIEVIYLYLLFHMPARACVAITSVVPGRRAVRAVRPGVGRRDLTALDFGLGGAYTPRRPDGILRHDHARVPVS